MWARINGHYLKQIYKIGNCPVIHIVYSKRDDAYFCKIRGGILKIRDSILFHAQNDISDKDIQIMKFKALLRAKEMGHDVDITCLDKYERV
jgi:hypothetical protein